MKDFLTQTFYGNTIENWSISIGLIIGSIIIAKILYWVIEKFVKSITAKTKSKLDDLIIDSIKEPIVMIIVVSACLWSFKRLHFSNSIDDFFRNAFTITYALNITWLIARTIDALITEYVVPYTKKSESDLDDQLLPILRKSLKSGTWVMGVIVGMNNAGFDVAALIAGLGIGGLALALAAQDTVKNIFGGLMVFIDKPFKTGDRIRIDGFDGTIIEIGVRSTRLQTLLGTVVTIPNATFSENSVENITREPAKKIVTNLGLTYNTPPEEIEKAILILKDIATKHLHTEEKVLVSFNAWGDFALGILFIYYIKKEGDVLATQTEINLAILKQFNAAKLDFAFPTQTILHQAIAN